MAENVEISTDLAINELTNPEDIFTPNLGHQEWLKQLPGLAEKLKPYQVKEYTFIGIPTSILIEYLVEHQTDRPHDLNEIFAIFYNELRQSVPSQSLRLFKTVISRRDALITNNADSRTLQETEQTIDRYRSTIGESFTKVPLAINTINHFIQQPEIESLIKNYIVQYGHQPKIIDGHSTDQTYGDILIKSLTITRSELDRLTNDWTSTEQDEALLLLYQRD